MQRKRSYSYILCPLNDTEMILSQVCANKINYTRIYGQGYGLKDCKWIIYRTHAGSHSGLGKTVNPIQ